jgi:hypothetical protein
MTTFKNSIITLLIFVSFFSNAQNKRTKALIEGIKSDYTFNNNKVTYQKVYEFSGKTTDELFDSALDFLENFTDAEIRIISQDSNRGKIKAWGFYKEYNNENSWGIDIKISASYNISIDIKDQKARIKIVLADYFKKEDGRALSNLLTSVAQTSKDYNISSSLYKASSDINTTIEGDLKVIDVYPFYQYSKLKNIFGRSFYYLNNHVVKIMPQFEKYMRENVNDKW